ncbi:hypothetical protein V6N12_062093 [Hibiscus sabdariffa]|uniref:Putative plant transposon protein domain-containing protein n=1 Tax=Hibiscus sabdariffa TaxID=183260 RepID=A0ABR2F7W0_9ROSI
MANTNFSARYSMIAVNNRWEEQDFYFDDSQPNYGMEQFVYNRLNELGWFRLARQPARANNNWVIEFYANNSAGKDHSIVRGRRVPANAATINAILGLPDIEPSFYAMLGGFEEEDFELIKDYLCEEGTACVTPSTRPSHRPDPRDPNAKNQASKVSKNCFQASSTGTQRVVPIPVSNGTDTLNKVPIPKSHRTDTSMWVSVPKANRTGTI